MSVCALAYSLGANVIEKHFTFNKMLPGNDHYHSMDREDLKVLMSRIADIRTLIGKNTENFDRTNETKSIIHARRSLFFAKKLTKGTTLDKSHMIAKRPGLGISPTLYENFIGRVLTRDVEEDDYIKNEDFH